MNFVYSDFTSFVRKVSDGCDGFKFRVERWGICRKI